MASMNIYLLYNGTCRQAFDLYKSVFGGDFAFITTFRDAPPGGGPAIAEEHLDEIMHMTLQLPDGTVIMGSDNGGVEEQKVFSGNNFSISVNATSAQEAHKVFNGLSEGGRVHMPLANTFWTELFGMLTDKYGINWMVSFGSQG